MDEVKHRKLKGVVVSDKMQKTVVVAVERLKMNEKYKKHYKVTKKFKAHDENNDYRTGDKVLIQESRPMSKEKRWKVMKKINNGI
ncbi:30S ribosomal protein S17 [Patescibacteria group bacterium]|nr:30S ribosomal protein S17 [Patescibacteria group bacterium]